MNTENDLIINGRVFVLTGYTYFPERLAELTAQIEQAGGVVEERVSERTHYLVLSHDDTDEWNKDEMAKVDYFMDTNHGVMLGMPAENTLFT
jgi:NAD-dependent DNA ligase